MRENILIRNVRVFNAASGVFAPECDIHIRNGVVVQMAGGIPCQPGYDVVEGESLCASIGWTDCHTHVGGFDPARTYPALGVTRIHEPGSFGAYTYHKFRRVNSGLSFPVTAYLYVGCWGVDNGELQTLDNLKAEPFLEVAARYPDEILGAKIRIDPRVNCDTKKSLRMAKELAVKAGIPLIVHPSRCKDPVEEILAVMDRDDVYAHTYSPVSPGIFDENGNIKKALWEAAERGVRFDLSHGSNNFGYDIARSAIRQGFIVETISTDLHFGNYNRPGISLAGVMTKAIQAGISLEDALKKVISAPLELLHVPSKAPVIEAGQTADITVFTVSHEGVELPDAVGRAEICQTVVKDVATVRGAMLTWSVDMAVPCNHYWGEEA